MNRCSAGIAGLRSSAILFVLWPGSKSQIANPPWPFINCIYAACSAQVFKKRFWMMLHGAPSPKPTICWGNDDYVLQGLELASASFGFCQFSQFNKNTPHKFSESSTRNRGSLRGGWVQGQSRNRGPASTNLGQRKASEIVQGTEHFDQNNAFFECNGWRLIQISLIFEIVFQILDG